MHVDLVAINTIQEKPTLLIQIDQQQQLYKVFDIQQMANQTTYIPEPIKIGPWCGSDGNPKTFRWGPCTSIKEITIGHKDDAVHYLKFESTDGNTDIWGTSTGVPIHQISIDVQGGEYLTFITGTTTENEDQQQVVVQSLKFLTNKNPDGYGSYGATAGNAFVFPQLPVANTEIVGFFGRADNLIYAIGIHVIPHAPAPYDAKPSNAKQVAKPSDAKPSVA